MTPSERDRAASPAALADLRALMHAGDPLGGAPAGLRTRIPAGRRARRSAVLILFGALDRIDAAASVSAVPDELDVLLTRRAPGMRHHPGQIAFPGGGREPGDADLVATALREAEEETGLDPTGVEVLGTLPEVPLPVSDNIVTPVLGWWRSPSPVAADAAESVDVFRVPVAELLDPAARGTSVLDRDGFRHRGPAFALGPRFDGGVVWGFTGILLASLFDRLGWSLTWDASREFPIEA
ncbi:CoA pyrophosphatase [Leucobacter allii]|uniref:NUDIX hydrolase n=1 Tax=Leucobacter allii TaxID=2932247 RepID=UPI001FD2E6DC|nr:CoA pyrophosphatase [Leucobacter allii]UOR01030.1 CoA pyrophosphatase [Leucobacter allii]